MAALWVVLGVGGACSQPASQESCRSDSDCARGAACVAGVCLAHAESVEPWDVELHPAAGSALGYTEHSGQPLAGTGTVLTVADAVTLDGLVNLPGDSNLDPASGVGLSFSIPSLILGHDPLTLYAAAYDKTQGGLQFQIQVPGAAVGLNAKVTLTPLAPADVRVPPTVLSTVAMVDALRLNLLGSQDLLVVHATLRDALGRPPVAFIASLWSGSVLVSNQAVSDAAGIVTLLTPEPAPGAMPLAGVRLRLTAADPTATQPELITNDLSSRGSNLPDLGTIRLPAFTNASSFAIPVTSAGIPVEGATVRFTTVLATINDGQASYVRESQSGNDGLVTVALIPGTAAGARSYEVTVSPPSTSHAAATCVDGYLIASAPGPPSAVPVGIPIDLPVKRRVTGRITGPEGKPAPGIIVTASEQAGSPDAGAPPSSSCQLPAPAPPATALTSATGMFELWLDPGPYRIAYQPGFGAPFAAWVESSVEVPAGGADLIHPVSLPPGVVVDGLVQAPSGAPVPGAEIDLLAPLTSGSLAGARALTDVDGHFRAVVPAAR